MDLTIIPTEEVVQEKVQYKNPKVKVEEKHYEIPKIEVSKNIQKFDKKPRVYTQNPYAYNSISLKKSQKTATPSQSASDLLTNPTYNTMGKFLGVDTIHDWNKYYDKVYAITEWARIKTGTDKLEKLMGFIGKQAKIVPNMGAKEIDNLYLYARMFLNKK